MTALLTFDAITYGAMMAFAALAVLASLALGAVLGYRYGQRKATRDIRTARRIRAGQPAREPVKTTA